MTIMSGDIASMRPRGVGQRLALDTLEPAVVMPSVSALSRFSASSNDMRVRVLGSKNRLTTVRPRSVGTFLIGRAPTSFIASAVSRIRSISPGSRSLDAEQVPAAERGGGAHPSTSTSSRPSISTSRTCTLCWREVGMLRPT